MDELSDIELVLQSQQSKRSAFNELVVRYQDRLYNAVYRLVNNQNDALDICQEAFVRAFKSIRNFRGKSSFHTWLYQIAMNQCYTHFDKSKKEKVKIDNQIRQEAKKVTAEKVNMADTKMLSLNPSKNAEVKERAQAIQTALDSLPDGLKKAVILKDVDNLSYNEIAQTLKLSVHVVRRYICEAREQLRESLKSYL